MVGALLAIVGGQDQTDSPSEAPRGAGAGDGGTGSGRGGEEEEPGADAKQMGRERVVLLMHETRVLSASDATRLLLLLSREVRRQTPHLFSSGRTFRAMPLQRGMSPQ